MIINGTKLPEAATMKEFGGEILELEGGVARIQYIVTEKYCNPRGVLQGGMAAVYLDDAMGFAVVGLLGVGQLFTTTDLTLHYLKPVPQGPIIAVGRVVRFGRQVGYLEGDILTEGDDLLVRGSSTVIKLSPEQFFHPGKAR